MNPTVFTAMTLAIIGAAGAHAEEIVVIVNTASATISKEQLVDFYLGRSSERTPIDQAVDSGIYVEFYRKATGRDTAQIKEIWSRILFTGRGLPPRQLVDSEAVKKAVAADPKAIGYIDKSALDATVKVALPLH
jgi:ABC-type phosphate transport system substrate-binding protein